jgi:nitrogen fixation protein FixH
MHIRPFFWAFLVIVCAGVLVFAGLITNHQAYPLQAQIEQVLTGPAGIALVHLHLMDSEDQPVDQATIHLSASMPAMSMEVQAASLEVLGQGRYLARFHLSMTGLWQLAFAVSAPGFLPAHPLIMLQMS